MATVVLLLATAIIVIPIKAETPQTFRLLAVEYQFSGVPMKSGQYLIRALLNFINWNNSTEYVSYIELLSLYNQSEIFDDCKRFYKGSSTKQNVETEIKGFLATAQPGEVTIFYCCTDGKQSVIGLDELVTDDELNSWLKSGGLPNTNLCVIIDACYSGSMIDDGQDGVLGNNKIVLCSSRSDQYAGGWSVSAWSVFTGQEKTRYVVGGPLLPLGIIGGFFGANDTNADGWISFSEDFEFAQRTTTEYALPRGLNQTPVAYNGLGYDPPFILRELPQPIANFSYTPTTPWIKETVTFNASNSDGTIVSYRWDFGDDNITEITEPTINHTYTREGNYTVILQVTNDFGASNTTALDMTVTYRSDINKDRTVNIIDITIVATAYGTEPGDDKWNSAADLDQNEQINILDISMVAKDYGKAI